MESSKVFKENLDIQRDLLERVAFGPLADIFDETLAYSKTTTKNSVRAMVHIGSERINTNRTDIILLMDSSLVYNSSETPVVDV